MCGIAGFYLREEADGNLMAQKLLDGIEHRGKDATGVAWWGLSDPDGRPLTISEGVGKPTVWHQKAPIPARQFIKSMAIPADARIMIGHTRAATQGEPSQNENNHPISVNRTIIGVHNGMIRNDDDLWEKIGKELRAAVVDSEVIFGGIYGLVQGEPGTKEYGPFLTQLEGGAAIAWLDTREVNRLQVGRVRSSPCIFGWTEAGSLVFASTKAAMEAGAKAGGLTIVGDATLDEGEIFTFGPEGTEKMEKFDLPPATWSSSGTNWRNNQLRSGSSSSSRGGGRRGSSTSGRSSSSSTTPSTSQRPPVRSGSAPSGGSSGTGSPESQAARKGFTDDQERQIASHTDMLRGLTDVPIKDGERKHSEIYEEREAAVERFVENEAKTAEAELIANRKGDKAEEAATVTAFERAEEAGAFAREGDWVSTTLDGTMRMAQIVSMPQSFPQGHYVLRVYLPQTPGHDTALVRRVWSDLEFVSSVGLADPAKVLD